MAQLTSAPVISIHGMIKPVINTQHEAHCPKAKTTASPWQVRSDPYNCRTLHLISAPKRRSASGGKSKITSLECIRN